MYAVTLAAGGEADAALLEAAFSDDFPRKLRTRLVAAMVAALPGWREASVKSLPSLPRLLDAECRVEVTAASSGGGGGAPSVLLLLRLQAARSSATELPHQRTLALGLDRAMLKEVVDSARQLHQRLELISSKAAEA